MSVSEGSTNINVPIDYIVLKKSDIEKYCSVTDLNVLDFITQKINRGREKDGSKPNTYIMCNTDETYAQKVYDLILTEESNLCK
jgi:hypothetical protein